VINTEPIEGEGFLKREFPPKEPLIEGLASKRDQIACVGRRRHGKTNLLLNLAVDGAVGEPTALGCAIPKPFRTVLFLLEDDPRELQDKLRQIVGERNMNRNLAIVTRDDFLEVNIGIDATKQAFQLTVEKVCDAHKPDLIAFDNLGQMVNGDYNDATKVDKLMTFTRKLASTFNAAVIIAAHPRKMDNKYPVKLADGDPDEFCEQTMGSSHFINSTGCIWALERDFNTGRALFMGGRQRAGGEYNKLYLVVDEYKRFQVLDNKLAQFELVVNTTQRVALWNRLPDPPDTFGYNEGEKLATASGAHKMSRSTYHDFLKLCKATGLLLQDENGKYSKAPDLPKPTGVGTWEMS
jgi:hypothetical protein